MPRFLCLWLPNWPIQRLVRTRPALKNQPVAVVFDGPRGSLIAACSRAAVARGIHTNMPLAEAQSLAPNLIVAPHNPAADRRALEKVAEACEQFTPCVALEDGEPASAGVATGNPESLLLDITNLNHLHGSEHQLAARIKTFFTRRGYHTRIAVAPTIAKAWALAHFAENPNDKIRMTNEKPHSSFVIRHSSLTNLPTESLRISSDTATLLHDLGIQTIAQLQQIPRDDLAQRFGDELLRRLDQFTGAAPEAIEPHRAVAELEVSYDLEEPAADRAVLMHVFNQLLHRLCRRFIARDQGAVLLLCTMQRAGASPPPSEDCKLQFIPSFRIALIEPTANPQQLLELIDLHLETLTLAEEVDRIQIRAAAVGRLGERQAELFTDRWLTDPHQLALLINRLSSRLGHDQVLRAVPRNSPVPERAVRWTSMTRCKEWEKERRGEREKKKRSRSLSCLSLSPSPCLPLLLHSEPHPIKVVSVAPDGPPQCIWLQNRREPIVHHVGPERIETLWWRGPTIRRDYYRIATASGDHLWIFRRLSDADWFLHGVFT
jgi:protein ImuB